MPKVGLDGPGIDAFVCQLEAAGVSQHVRVDLHIKAGDLAGTLNHRLEAPFRKWRPAFADEYEWGFGLLLALQPPQSPQLPSSQWMRRRTATLESTDVQDRVFEVDLIPTKVDQFRCT